MSDFRTQYAIPAQSRHGFPLALSRFSHLIALAATLLYLVQSWGYAHSLDSVLDEGAYLYKGYAFVTGQYRIYQEYGFWSNHMPLAFYIPGVVQAVFGPGLRAGRYFAIILGALMLLGIWIVTRRLAGNWWAALVLAGLALNPAIIKMYSVAISQVLIACMLVWALVLTLGEQRPLWQLGLGAAIAAVIWMTRINLFPVFPLLLVYLFWQNGLRKGGIAALFGVLTLLLLHAIFFPGILRMYAYWLPEPMAALLNSWLPPRATPYWNPEISLADRINSFFRTYRFHFLSLTGVISTWMLFPLKPDWRHNPRHRAVIFLSALFLALFALHFWATMGKNYCTFCLEGYTAFFACLGWILMALTSASWSKAINLQRQAIAAIFILVFTAGIGYSAYADIGRPLLEMNFSTLGLPSIGVLLENKYQIPDSQAQYLVATGAGLATGFAILSVTGLWVLSRRKDAKQNSLYGYTILMVYMLVGASLTPTMILGGGYRTYDCGGDIIASYEKVGAHLARMIPPGSKVYWKGGLSFAPLLYVPGIEIYPPQVNGDYSFYLDGDARELEKYGFWNPDSSNRWLDETDYALIEERYYRKWFKDTVNPSRFIELEPTPEKAACRNDSQIRIFKRLD